jgi:hypothetical protein
VIDPDMVWRDSTQVISDRLLLHYHRFLNKKENVLKFFFLSYFKCVDVCKLFILIDSSSSSFLFDDAIIYLFCHRLVSIDTHTRRVNKYNFRIRRKKRGKKHIF